MKKMNVIKKLMVGTVIVAMLVPTTAFAASTNPNTNKAYVNSVGSATGDIAILDNAQYSVTGQDTTQEKSSKYTTHDVTTNPTVTSNCDVYATIEEGSKVYDPENPNADESGFVDGQIVVGVPVELILDGTPDAQGYYKGSGLVKVKGNIAGTTVINVVPEDTVTMSQTGKSDITATIEQEYTKFVIPTSSLTGTDVNKQVTPDFNDNATSTVEIKTNQATAGSWAGTFTYSISVSNVA